MTAISRRSPRYPEGESLQTVDGAVPGMAGDVRVLYRPAGGERMENDESGRRPS